MASALILSLVLSPVSTPVSVLAAALLGSGSFGDLVLLFSVDFLVMIKPRVSVFYHAFVKNVYNIVLLMMIF